MAGCRCVRAAPTGRVWATSAPSRRGCPRATVARQLACPRGSDPARPSGATEAARRTIASAATCRSRSPTPRCQGRSPERAVPAFRRLFDRPVRCARRSTADFGARRRRHRSLTSCACTRPRWTVTPARLGWRGTAPLRGQTAGATRPAEATGTGSMCCARSFSSSSAR